METAGWFWSCCGKQSTEGNKNKS